MIKSEKLPVSLTANHAKVLMKMGECTSESSRQLGFSFKALSSVYISGEINGINSYRLNFPLKLPFKY